MIISVPPAMVNQVFTSMLLTTSPRRSASSRRRGVGSSVRSFDSLFSSAMGQALFTCHCEERSDEAIQSFLFSRF